ncbi:GNAT family N-acetyltransferase [Leifsonia sp. A12D58]|uniref:GNAT family N-acetyltransferase n=1 Tax=Leifsonia sp. A12D58 TaxID=3397674 RepID=UPI0039E1E1A3
MTLLKTSRASSVTEPVESFVYVSADDALAQPLLDELEREYETRYGTFFGEPASAEIHRYPTSAFAAPHGAFVILVRDGVPIAGGAFKQFDAHTAEFKRIWTSSAHRRQGLARRVVAELEAESERRGYNRVYLTTGPKQPEAKNLYLYTGYTPLFDTALTPDQVVIHGFAKTLDGSELDVASITAAHLASLGILHGEGDSHDKHDS